MTLLYPFPGHFQFTVFIGANNGMALKWSSGLRWSSRSFLFIKPAGIAYPAWFTVEALHFAPLIFPGCNPEYLISPEAIKWLCRSNRESGNRDGRQRARKPYRFFKSERFICQCANRTNIDHIAAEIIVDGLGYICGDRRIATVNNAMHPLVGDLICHKVQR